VGDGAAVVGEDAGRRGRRSTDDGGDAGVCANEGRTYLPHNFAALRTARADTGGVDATHGARRPQIVAHALPERSSRPVAVAVWAAPQQRPVHGLKWAVV
jgi:hypothetical protein